MILLSMVITKLKYPKRMTWVVDKLFLYMIFVLTLQSVVGEPCRFNVDPCICTTSNFTLDLRSLMEARKGQDFVAVGEANTFTYYVQPCNRKLNTLLPACNSVSPDLVSCQVHDQSTMSYGLGVLNKYDATQNLDTYVLTNSFKSLTDPITRIMHLTIRCSEQESYFTYEGNSGQPDITYKFTLATSYICTSEKSKGLSPGSVMVIIFFVLLIVYLVVGLLFQKFVRKAQGTEIIPNYTFWTDFPVLVKDGAVFTFQCCKAGSAGYDKI